MVSYILWMGVNDVCFAFVMNNMALELYHCPRWQLPLLRMSLPWRKRQLTDAVIAKKARERAAELQALLGYGVVRPTPDEVSATIAK